MNASIRTRLLISLLIVTIASAVFISWYFLNELEQYGVRKLLERVEGDARIVAALAGAAGEGLAGPVSPDEGFAENLDEALADAVTVPNTRVLLLNAQGRVVADSAAGSTPDIDVETDLGDRLEVRRALEGQVSRAQRPAPDGKLQIYAAAPVHIGGEVVGAAYVSARTFSIASLVRDYRSRLAALVIAFVVVTLALAELLSRWLSRPLRSLEETAAAFAAGDHTVRVRPSGSRETRALGKAFNSLAEEVQRMVAELRAEERIKSRFVSDVSHELRTPLTAIRGTAETLLQGDVPEEDTQRFLSTIVREADRLARLADDLLTLQRIEGATGELPLQRVSLRDVAERAVEGLQHLAEQRGVRVEVTGSAPEVLGDPDRLQQVIANLLDNASRMMPEGGVVHVELRESPSGSIIEVADRGPGLPPDAVDRVFDRFYRSQPSRDRLSGGAGLGLAIVKAIVDRHAGSIEAENRPGGGAVFRVTLPKITRG